MNLRRHLLAVVWFGMLAFVAGSLIWAIAERVFNALSMGGTE